MKNILKNLLTFIVKALITFLALWLALKIFAKSDHEFTPITVGAISAVIAVFVDWVCDVLLKKFVKPESKLSQFTAYTQFI